MKLLDKFTRITPHHAAQNPSSFIQSPGERVLRKLAVSTDFHMHRPKIFRNCVYGKLFHQENQMKKPAFHTMWVIVSIFCMNMGTNPQEHCHKIGNDISIVSSDNEIQVLLKEKKTMFLDIFTHIASLKRPGVRGGNYLL